ncbi:DUF368 domain-containing protein [Alloalcanivorax xenomutans]|jgi:putative membrane protein|uniref:DUF368 domain-containing protein n=1 Tax=Alloalcanivorax xenomutans TaxID=1094342 RepID=UPI0003B8EDB5|nr:hypothetical protein Q668_01575 [Alcanivorax sp. PN-3]
MTALFRPGIYCRGIAMGAADVVPGVSGGTLALITGIYEELIATLGGVRPGLLTIWRRQGFAAFWRAGNFTFLFSLLAGILTSIALLARLITWFLEHHPVPVWAFFSGLIAASIPMILKPLVRRGPPQWAAFLTGTLAAVAISLAPGLHGAGTGPLVFFLGGAVAICAMILPGISGSFILLLLGLYEPVLQAVRDGQWSLLAAFAGGCAVGLLSFVHLLKWLLGRYHDTVMALLGGFMAGSLVKLWPWRLGAESGLGERWLTPNQYAQATGEGTQILIAVLAALLGMAVVWLLSLAAPVHNVAKETTD